MHTIHTTPGFIIGSRPYGDAGKILSVFTRDFGLIYATAQGIRLERSKLRYYIQDYSFGIYSLVRGREFWRVTSATAEPRIDSIVGRPDFVLTTQELVARVALLLRRLLHGEEAHPELFDCVFECAISLTGTTLNDDLMQTLESLVVARMLFALGYIGNITDLNEEMQSTAITPELLHILVGKRTLLNQHINKALKESML